MTNQLRTWSTSVR